MDRKSKVEQLKKNVMKLSVSPETVNAYLEEQKSSALKQKVKLDSVLGRPNVFLRDLIQIPEIFEALHIGMDRNLHLDEIDLVETLVKYEGYIQREKEMADKMQRLEHIPLGQEFNYFALPSLSHEAREKLMKIKPDNLGQASRISGVSPADISVLLVKLGR